MYKLSIIPIVLLFLVFGNCDKTEDIDKPVDEEDSLLLDVLSTVEYVGDSVVYIGGKILSNGGSPIIEKGVYLTTRENELLVRYPNDSIKHPIGEGDEDFKFLFENTVLNAYYFRAYVINEYDTSFGREKWFRNDFPIHATLPRVITHEPINITNNSAVLKGEISDYNEFPIVSKGFYFSTLSKPELYGDTIFVSGDEYEFSLEMNNLSSDLIYRVKAFARNVKYENIGIEISFKTYSDSEVPCLGCETGLFIDNRDSMEYKWGQDRQPILDGRKLSLFAGY